MGISGIPLSPRSGYGEWDGRVPGVYTPGYSLTSRWDEDGETSKTGGPWGGPWGDHGVIRATKVFERATKQLGIPESF